MQKLIGVGGALFADFDNDGYKDYFVTNGFRKNRLDNDFQIELKKIKKKYINIPEKIKKEIYESIPETKLSNHLFLNNQKLHFKDVSKEAGIDNISFSNGAAYADLDNDGDLDLIVNNIDQEAFIFRNNSSNTKFLRVNLVDSTNKSLFYNAKVFMHYQGKVQLQEYSPTRGYQSCVEHVLHFGFPEKINLIDSIIVIWTDQQKTKLSNISVRNQDLKISKDLKNLTKTSKPNLFPTLFKTSDAINFGIDFIHEENNFDDFLEEKLMPHRQSRLGPFISVGDVNGDSLDDFFVGGACDQAGALYLQSQENFLLAPEQIWKKDKKSEDMGSLFFDFDNDNDLDLYVVSGGGGAVKDNESLLQDRLYINDGNGVFSKSNNILPKIISSGQQVKASDIDQDGDLDLFIGGRTVPGKYPYSPKSYLLINDNGKYTDQTKSWFSNTDIAKLGMITDFVFTDLNNDQRYDLVLVGEWMPILCFLNTGQNFVNESSAYGFDKLKGWWYSVEQGDFNEDGRPDFLFGNIGRNVKFKASNKKPFHIYTNDFDNTGDEDIVLSYYYNGKKVPSRGRECSSGEIPLVTKKCKTYKDFAEASIEDIYGKDQIEEALHFEVNTFASLIALSDNAEEYKIEELNIEAQFSPINRFIVADFNSDSKQDIILGGNMYHTEVETPRYDAGRGLFLQGNGDGSFKALPVVKSGIYISKDVKDIDRFLIKDKIALIVANNNENLQIILESND